MLIIIIIIIIIIITGFTYILITCKNLSNEQT